jgi:pre-mRNA-processing factor SLU7
MSRDELRRKREIEDARKAGTVAPEEDADGNMINPHNPEFISKRPWYLGDSGPSLKHQNVQKKSHFLSLAEADNLAIRARKEMLQNKSTGQKNWVRGKKKDVFGKKTRDEFYELNSGKKEDGFDVRNGDGGKMTYDAKRDRWIGYNPNDHKTTIKHFEDVEQARRKKRVEELDKKVTSGEDGKKSKKEKKEKKEKASKKDDDGKKSRGRSGGKASGSGQEPEDGNEISSSDSDSGASDSDIGADSDSDYESDAEGDLDEKSDFLQEEKLFHSRVARQGGIGGAQMMTTVRNLRIREDTAKYLRNLDPNSAYYDPKTRSMRDNPLPHLAPEDSVFAGDNFVRISGDARELAKTQLYAWDSFNKGVDMHPQANPSQAELAKKNFTEKHATLKDDQREAILEKYGGAQHLDAPPRELLLAQTESYVEYSRDGRVIKGTDKGVVRSKYVEDVLENNHTGVWGSYFDTKTFSWGYSDDYSTQRNSYSTGVAGKQLRMEAQAMSNLTTRPMLSKPASEDADAAGGAPPVDKPNAADMYGEVDTQVELDKKKLKDALKKIEEDDRRNVEQDESKDKKRKYTSLGGKFEVTPEEMEAYRMKKTRGDDPMSKISSEELLDYDK